MFQKIKSFFDPENNTPLSPGLIVALVVGGCLSLAMVLVPLVIWLKPQVPVICGVKGTVVIQSDESAQTALLSGVEGVLLSENGQRSVYPVQVRIYDVYGIESDAAIPGRYKAIYSCQDTKGHSAQEVESVLVVNPVDREPPVISGVTDLNITIGMKPMYHNGITVTDNLDSDVRLRIDSRNVDLEQTGVYTVVYSAVDASGNTARATAQVTVEPPRVGDFPMPDHITQEELDAKADAVLSQIIYPRMEPLQKAEAIYHYVRRHIRPTIETNHSDPTQAAYVALVGGQGDSYYCTALSQLLLNRVGIPSQEVQRQGGKTDHYWLLVDAGTGYHHFDASPHLPHHDLQSFMLTEEEAQRYTEEVAEDEKNYYVYDKDTCSVTVVEREYPSATPAPTVTPTAEPTATPSATPSVRPTPAPQVRPPRPTPASRPVVPPAHPTPVPPPAISHPVTTPAPSVAPSPSASLSPETFSTPSVATPTPEVPVINSALPTPPSSAPSPAPTPEPPADSSEPIPTAAPPAPTQELPPPPANSAAAPQG